MKEVKIKYVTTGINVIGGGVWKNYIHVGKIYQVENTKSSSILVITIPKQLAGIKVTYKQSIDIRTLEDV